MIARGGVGFSGGVRANDLNVQLLPVQVATLKGAGVGYIDTIGFFCSESYCPAVVNDLLVHRDEGHITNSYAVWLRPMLDPIFQEASK